MPAIIVDGAAVEIFPGIPFEDAAGIAHPSNWLELAGLEDRLAAGVMDIAEPPAPSAGNVITITGLTVVDGKPTRTFTEDPVPTPPAPTAPDNPTLGDWRVGLVLWKTATGNRRDDLIEKIKALLASGHPLGPVADERVNYSNNVLRAELMLLKDAVGFTTDDVEESLWRADRVRQGDLSGVWPLPAEQSAAA